MKAIASTGFGFATPCGRVRLSDHDAETRQHFERTEEVPVVFVAQADDRVIGFLELDYRKYAPGCTSSPVPFIEGWYVDPAHQGQGVGRALVGAAEAWARVRCPCARIERLLSF